MADDPASVAFDAEEAVGATLARMRKQAGLTGKQLGELVGLSQPTISRIERGIGGSADPRDVLRIGRIAEALGANEAAARLLMERAEQSQNQMTDWRPSSPGLPTRGQDMRGWEADTKIFRIFQPAVVIGLLQTDQYARAVLSAFRSNASADRDQPEPAVLEAVSARVQRQEVLGDGNRSFRFVMMEAVFSNRICPPGAMVGQIGRIREVAAQKNVTIKIVPADAMLEMAPFHGFELLDDRTVVVDLFNTAISSHGRADAALYRRLFDQFEGEAVTDIDPILTNYERIYAEKSLSDGSR